MYNSALPKFQDYGQKVHRMEMLKLLRMLKLQLPMMSYGMCQMHLKSSAESLCCPKGFHWCADRIFRTASCLVHSSDLKLMGFQSFNLHNLHLPARTTCTLFSCSVLCLQDESMFSWMCSASSARIFASVCIAGGWLTEVSHIFLTNQSHFLYGNGTIKWNCIFHLPAAIYHNDIVCHWVCSSQEMTTQFNDMSNFILCSLICVSWVYPPMEVWCARGFEGAEQKTAIDKKQLHSAKFMMSSRLRDNLKLHCKNGRMRLLTCSIGKMSIFETEVHVPELYSTHSQESWPILPCLIVQIRFDSV